MLDAVVEADGVIIVSPEHNYSVPGISESALDWVSRMPAQPFAGKPVATRPGSPGVVGGARAQYHPQQILVFLDAAAMNKPEVMVSQIAT